MAKNNDDLANALNALAAGDVHDDHHGGSGAEHHHDEVHVAPPPAPTPPPVAARPSAPKPTPKPVAPPPPQAPAAPARAARPAAPGPTPAAPTPRAAAPVPQRPAAPTSRPAAPTPVRPTAPPPVEAPAAPVARTRPAAPVRAAAPVAPPEETYEEPGAGDSGEVFDDDDMNMPAPSADVFRAKPKAAPKPRTHYTHTLQFKQTIIPVMLTIGVIALISAGIPYLAPAESNLAAMKQPMFIGVMAAVGVVFLVMGVLNALQVKSSLEAMKKQGR